MAKKRAQASNADFVRCTDYRLSIVNNAANGIDLDLKVIGDDGDEYNLQVNQFSDRTALVQSMLHKIGNLWPALDFELRSDTANRIIEIR